MEFAILLFLIIIVLVCTFNNPEIAQYAIGAGVIIFGIHTLNYRDPNYDEDDNDDNTNIKSDENDDSQEIVVDQNNDDPVSSRKTERSTTNNPNDTFVSHTPNSSSISEKNRYAIDQVYGNKMNTTTNLTTKHNMRIGDRDRKAIIAQVKGRRANTYEPYYRQELSEHGSKRWWEPEDVLVRMLPDKQMNTIPMGRFTDENTEKNLSDYNTIGVNW